MRQRIYEPVPIAPSVNIPDTARRARGLTLPIGGGEARSRSDDPAALRLTSFVAEGALRGGWETPPGSARLCLRLIRTGTRHRRGLTWQLTVRAELVVDVPPTGSEGEGQTRKARLVA